jgi:hypothetical protein
MEIPVVEGSVTVTKQDGVAHLSEDEISRFAEAAEPVPPNRRSRSRVPAVPRTPAGLGRGRGRLMILGGVGIAALLMFPPGGAVVAGVFLSRRR